MGPSAVGVAPEAQVCPGVFLGDPVGWREVLSGLSTHLGLDEGDEVPVKDRLRQKAVGVSRFDADTIRRHDG